MNSELTYTDIKHLFSRVCDWKNELVDSKVLSLRDREKTTKLILDKLNSRDGQIRYIASHMIIVFGIEQAKTKLIERIRDLDTLNNVGTMTYALSHLDCSNHLVEVFDILATQSFSLIGALFIISFLNN